MTLLYIRYRIAQKHHPHFFEVIKQIEKDLNQFPSVAINGLAQCTEETENFIQTIALRESIQKDQTLGMYILDKLGVFQEDILEMRYYKTVKSSTSI